MRLYFEGTDQNGVSQARYIVETHLSGRELSICFIVFLSYKGKMIFISSTQTTYVFNLCMY